MSICLSYSSADRLLEYLAHKNFELEPASGSVLDSCTANAREAAEVLERSGFHDIGPVELLVGKNSAIRNNSAVVGHVWKGFLPDGMIKRVDDELYVVSPEFCLLQQARELHVVNLCQMLGRYTATKSLTMADNGKKVLRDRRPLLDWNNLQEFFRHMRGAHGTGPLREAMRWTCPGAASPWETNLQLVMTLPTWYGGFGLPKPQMNYEVPLSSEAKKLYPHELIRIDVCWPEDKYGLEYQGEEHGNQLGSDYARCLAAHCEGYMLWYVAHEQMCDAAQMDYLARIVANQVRKKINPTTWPSKDEVERLLAILGGGAVPSRDERIGRGRARRRH